MNETELAQLFRSWMNDFTTVPRFAEYLGCSEAQALSIITAGRLINNAFAEYLQDMTRFEAVAVE